MLTMKRHTPHRKRIIMTVALLGVVVIGGVSGVVNAAPSPNRSGRDFTGYIQRLQTRNTTTTPSTTKTTTTPTTTTTTTTPAPTTTTPAATPVAAPVQEKHTVAPVAAPTAPAAPVTPDTAASAAQTTASQAAYTPTPVTYTSQKISTELRNQLVMLAIVGITTGMLLYGITMIKGTPKFAKRATVPVIAIPHSIPVKVVNR